MNWLKAKDCLRMIKTTFSAINHQKFDRLYDITNNYNKSTLLDKLVYWWQISTYTLGDGKIWFTRSIEQIASDSKISERSVSRYLSEFEAKGLIERKRKLFTKRRLYIRITDKLLSIITTEKQKELTTSLLTPTNSNDKSDRKCVFLAQHGNTENANMAISIYKKQDTNLLVNNNIVTSPLPVDNLKITPINKNSSKYPIYAVESIIGERLSVKEKNYIKGMMHNVQKQYGVLFGTPERLFSEIVFSLLNEEQFPGVTDFNLKINIISKLLRKKIWKTPKGFYKYADYGAYFIGEYTKTENPKKPFKNNESLNKAELKQEFTRLKDQIDEIDRDISSHTHQFRETQNKLVNNPNYIHLINSISVSLIQNYQQQLSLFSDIYQLEEVLQSTTFIPPNQIKQEQGAQINLLNLLEERLRALEYGIFDAFCDASKAGCSHNETDIAYKHYEQVTDLRTKVEQLIREREEVYEFEIAI